MLLLCINISRADGKFAKGIHVASIFDRLEANAKRYNEINDSILMPKDREEWIQLFLHRAEVFKSLYKENTSLIEDMEVFFMQDYEDIDTAVYTPLSRKLSYFAENRVIDPFVIETVVMNALPYYEKRGGDDLLYIYSTLSALNYFYYLSGDQSALRKHADYSIKLLDTKPEHPSPEYYELALKSCLNLLRNNLLNDGILSRTQYYSYYYKIKAFCDRIPEDVRNTPRLKEYIDYMDVRLKSLVHNYYLFKYPVGTDAHADSVYRAYVRQYEGQRTDSLSRETLTYFIVRMGLEPQNAIRYTLYADSLFDATCDLDNEEQLKMNTADIVQYLYDLIFMVDNSTLPAEQKHAMMCKYMDSAEKVIRIIGHNHMSYDVIRPLAVFSSHPRVMKYLTTQERLRYLSELTVTTSVTTYAHSSLVGEIAKVIMEGVVKYRPELLKGCLGLNTVKNVRQHEEDLKAFIGEAALYHDLGKNSMIGLINNDFAKITDHAYEVIKLHPELGLKYLEIDPVLRQYHDITLGHHKWYNGKGGYPESYDNTKSDVRIIIDMVTISDCLEAATDRLGRNYSSVKMFDTLIDEFSEFAGTRFNPDIVALIKEHKDVYDKMNFIVEKGWLYNYYDIYKDFFVDDAHRE